MQNMKFENAALFLRLGLTSSLIRQENGDFRKRSSNRRNLETSAFRFRVGRKTSVFNFSDVMGKRCFHTMTE